MANSNHTSRSTVAAPSRTARTHLHRIYAEERVIRDLLDNIYGPTVGGASCGDLRQVLAHMTAAAELLQRIEQRESQCIESLSREAA